MPLVHDHPRVGDITVETRGQSIKDDADLIAFASEVLAGHPMT